MLLSKANGDQVSVTGDKLDLYADFVLHARLLDEEEESPFVHGLLDAAANKVAELCCFSFVQETRVAAFSAFGCLGLILPRKPAFSITAVKYYDLLGAEQTVDPSVYRLWNAGTSLKLPEVHLVYGKQWPSSFDIQPRPDAVNVTYTAGYEASDGVPPSVRLAIFQLAAHWYQNREPTISGTIITPIPLQVQFLLSDYRVW